MTDKSLGQAAYEAYVKTRGDQYPTRTYWPWGDLDQYEQAAWEAAARAAVETRTAQ